MMDKYTRILTDLMNGAGHLKGSSFIEYKYGLAQRYKKKYGKYPNIFNDKSLVMALVKRGELDKEVLQ